MSKNIRVATYNVLSSSLAGADYFTKCQKEYLAPDYRFSVLKTKLQSEVEKKSVICLQEVSTLWAGYLHYYFAANDYHLVTGMYGSKFNGYMGIATAIPRDEYVLLDADISRLSDTKRNPRKPKESFIKQLISRVILFLYTTYLKVLRIEQPSNPWWLSSNRYNQIITVRLQSKHNPNKKFVVGNYHMPCMYKEPGVMLIHSALMAQHVHRIASKCTPADPYVIAGDFNLKPDSSMYALLTSGIHFTALVTYE